MGFLAADVKKWLVSLALLVAMVGACLGGMSATASEQADLESEEDEAALYLESLDCEGCHVNEAPTVSTEDDEEEGEIEDNTADDGEEMAPSKETDDAEGAEEETNEEDSSATLGDLHAIVGCLTCHNDTATLATVHESAGTRLPKRLKKTSVEDEVCLTCHGSYEELAELTSDSTTLTDEEGTVVNPHDLPENSDHATITCVDCHQVHAESTLESKAQLVCASCHHENVYECGTCHVH